MKYQGTSTWKWRLYRIVTSKKQRVDQASKSAFGLRRPISRAQLQMSLNLCSSQLKEAHLLIAKAKLMGFIFAWFAWNLNNTT